ncbi:hypothetical protein Acr_00g0048180 [Actinidia rufa]|uniref:Small acidic protein-like domain-containing protein n=1 Tax=Actinidia rufa TaxID=165716 RepID=A0A7J0DKL3_9ERIC|nr:hypothetical protein Acr_00g0048180 [Actinidia rufa]
MESNSPSLSPDNADAKAAFRKPSNDASNRKYRRRSPVSGSSSSDGSPKRQRNSSPLHSREDPVRDSDPRRRKDDRRELDKDSGRNHQGRSGDSYRHSGRQSSRGSHNYHRRDEYVRREKRESERCRTRDRLHGDDKYPRDRSDGSGNRTRDKDRETSSVEYQKYKDKDSLSDRAGSGRRHTNSNVEDIKSGERDRHKLDGDDRDEKRDYQRSSGDHKGDFSPVHEESRGHRNDSMSRRESVGHRSKEASKNGPRELDGQKYTKEENKKYDDQETDRHKDGNDREQKNQESAAKRPKLFSLGSDNEKDADERQSSSSKQAQEYVSKFTSEQVSEKGGVTANDIDAAKVAAMKAAELVNKNLIGTGYMSTDQKKKLLWGNKKNTTAEESGHRWDTTLFSDRERQEKFNKLMGVKGELKVEHKPDNQESSGFEKQSEQLQLDLEKQYTAGLRRRDGRTVGLGL